MVPFAMFSSFPDMAGGSFTKYSTIVLYVIFSHYLVQTHKLNTCRAREDLDMGKQPGDWAFACVVGESGSWGLPSLRMTLVS